VIIFGGKLDKVTICFRILAQKYDNERRFFIPQNGYFLSGSFQRLPGELSRNPALGGVSFAKGLYDTNPLKPYYTIPEFLKRFQIVAAADWGLYRVRES
jgi:hypothetical protein